LGGSVSAGAAQLDELRERAMVAYARGDVELAASLYVDDGVQHPPGRPPIVGRQAIRESYDMLFARGGLTLRMDPWETVIRRGEARERGAYHLAIGAQTLLAGKYMAVMAETEDGGWRYVWSMVTPD